MLDMKIAIVKMRLTPDSSASRRANPIIVVSMFQEFKLPVWEECLRTMRCGEVTEFVVDKRLCANYFLVSKGYRQYAGITKEPSSHHCCGTMFKEKTGCPKLDLLLEKPCDLKFTFELLSVEEAGSYEKEGWSMTPEERLSNVPRLKEQGNELFRQGDIAGACAKYFDAISHVEALLLREKPGGDEYRAIEDLKWPILLNYAQCKLSQGEFYEVIRHCSDVLAKDPNSSKALYRRAKAHVGAWNPDEARKDFARLLQLEPSLKTTIEKSLKEIAEQEQIQAKKDKDLLKKMFTK
ncbi:AH receptor-interacting protein-like [Tropilaelaps mercedesae]|uniref:AH receptor-interacting protein-like n=1 Tax=Tropilaelaps mercedesae TaxID=418985 RepID=A0A1V9X388_9ACAR|nr:AH receptor-interacting protein-like [Tropilaelaps mercedesae]